MIAVVAKPAPAERGDAGAPRIVPFLLRRDRIVLPLWILGTAGLLLSSASAAGNTYPTAQARAERYQQLQELPIFVLFQSAAFDDTLPALAAQQAFGATTILAAIGAMLLVVRHTRAEEQHGRRELLGSTAIGRNAGVAATLLIVLAAGVLIGLLGIVGLAAAGLPAPGSLLLGLIVCGAAWIGAVLGAVLAQITENARTAGVAGVVLVLGLHYLRGIGHVAGPGMEWISMLSPAGWLEGVRPYAGDRWPMLLLVVGFVVLGALAALALSSRRDLGMGLLAPREGRAPAPAYLRGVFGLAWRQNATSFLTWAAAIAVVGVAFGSVGAGAMAEYADSPWIAEYAATMRISDPAQTFFVYVVFVFVFPIAAYAILTALRLRSDETTGKAELLLSVPLTRSRWAVATILAALIGPAALLIILGLSLTAPDVNGMFPLTLSLIPAVWVIVGIVVLAIGFVPSAAFPVAWAALGIGIAGEILVKAGLPDVIYLATSPIAHVNPYYTTPTSWLVLLVITAITIALGVVGIGRRDLDR